MIIYNVIWKDRHSDTTAKPFIDLDEAVAWARESVLRILRHPEDYKETHVPGWEFHAEYSCEGDCIYITKEEVLLKATPATREQEIYRAAMRLFGSENQMEMLAEECCELAAAVNHFKRERICIDDLCEEIADVDIMIGQMRVMYSALIDMTKSSKLSRLEKKMADFKKKA